MTRNSKKIKAGIIGLGVGQAHIAGYQSHPRCEVTALCDFSPDKRAQAAKRYPKMKITACDSDILSDPSIGIVSIASYDHFHFPQIVAALKSGKHVFVEKPFCLYPSQARRIRSLLESRKRLQFSSNLILRKSPRFIDLKKRLERGQLGRLYYLEGDYNYGRIHKLTDGWRGRIDFYSVVYGGGVHLIDLLLWLSGERVSEVSAFGNRLSTAGSRFRYNDCVAALLKCKSGAVMKVTSNYSCVFPHFHAVNLYGTKATFTNGLKQAALFDSRDPAARPKAIRSDYPGVKKSDLIYNFVEAALGRRKPEIGVDEVFDTMSVCFAVEKAARTGKTVKVVYY